jgi:L-fuculose-phosphate aldolase
MAPNDICVIRLTDLYQVAGHRRPSVEHKLHANVLRARRDCRASIHTHQPIASAYTLLRRDLDIHQPVHQSMLGTKAVCVLYAPSGTSWLASKLRKSLSPEVNAYLLGNHGVVCCGSTLGEAVARVEALEKECSDFFRKAISSQMGSDHNRHLSDVLMLLAGDEELEFAQ